ncbi:MAG: protease modulator HflC [Proteobacteria bacterium]|nr:protease modulator HflC [Pseudomonadota bacterium]
MKNASLAIIGIVVVVAGIIASSALFVVNQREQVLVLRLGNPKIVHNTPGLKFKVPFIESVVSFDKRVLDYDARAEEVPTQDQKQLVVDAFTRYRIVNPLAFFQTVTNEFSMETRLGNVINANLRAVFGEVALAVLLTPTRSELIRNIADRVKEQTKEFGIEVLDVRIKRVDLPPENSQAIFRRMQTQREQEARKIRAEGNKESQRIRTDADKQARIIRANAQRSGQKTRGEGDGEAQRVYNLAYGQDREFYFFWDSMRSLREGLRGETTSFVGAPEGDFYRFFGDISGTNMEARESERRAGAQSQR